MKRIVIMMGAILVFAHSVVFAAGLVVGNSAVDFNLKPVNMEKSVSLAEFKGEKVVVVGLFHICNPCRKQTVQLQKVNEQLQGKDVAVLGINTDGNSVAQIREFLKSVPVGVTFPFLADPEKGIDKSYDIRVSPMVIIIDKKGKIASKAFFVSSESIIKEVNNLL